MNCGEKCKYYKQEISYCRPASSFYDPYPASIREQKVKCYFPVNPVEIRSRIGKPCGNFIDKEDYE